MKKSKSENDWVKLALTIKLVRRQIFQMLLPELIGVPKTIYNRQLDRFINSLDQMKSDLEDRFAKEYPDDFNPDIFYGE